MVSHYADTWKQFVVRCCFRRMQLVGRGSPQRAWLRSRSELRHWQPSNWQQIILSIDRDTHYQIYIVETMPACPNLGFHMKCNQVKLQPRF